MLALAAERQNVSQTTLKMRGGSTKFAHDALGGSSVSILEEPTGTTYAALLDFALESSSACSLVWRHSLPHGADAIEIAGDLRDVLVEEVETDQWPGTRLFGHTATLRFFRMSRVAHRVLAGASGLFAWVAPNRPEDLAFYTDDGRPWLGSVSHERDAFLYLDAVALHTLTAAVPGLVVGSMPTVHPSS